MTEIQLNDEQRQALKAAKQEYEDAVEKAGRELGKFREAQNAKFNRMVREKEMRTDALLEEAQDMLLRYVGKFDPKTQDMEFCEETGIVTILAKSDKPEECKCLGCQIAKALASLRHHKG